MDLPHRQALSTPEKSQPTGQDLQNPSIATLRVGRMSASGRWMNRISRACDVSSWRHEGAEMESASHRRLAGSRRRHPRRGCWGRVRPLFRLVIRPVLDAAPTLRSQGRTTRTAVSPWRGANANRKRPVRRRTVRRRLRQSITRRDVATIRTRGPGCPLLFGQSRPEATKSDVRHQW